MAQCSLARGTRAALAGCLLGAASAYAAGGAPAQTHLRAVGAVDGAADEEWRRDVLAAFGEVADVRAQEGGVGQDKKAARPMKMQVPEHELKNLVSKLSTTCNSQFSDILAGKSELHTFGDAAGHTKETCVQMKGSFCKMNAQVTQKVQGGGRKMKSVTQVSGNSCLPQDCMAEGDLKVLTNFMKVKARDSMKTNADVDIDLQMDCGSNATEAQKETPAASKQLVKTETPAAPKQPVEKTV